MAFMPPPVDPAQAPMTLSIIRKMGRNEGHIEKLSLEKPVVVAIETV
jgi:hypothetical protein